MTTGVQIAVAALAVSLLSSGVGGVWYAAAQDSKVTTIEERQEKIVVSQEAAVEEREELRDTTILLQRYHIAQNAKEEGIEEGRELALREMCDDGRITGDICDGE